MKRFTLTGLVGFGCLLPLMGCVVPAQPVYAPPPMVSPVVVGPPPVVVGRPRYYRRWYRGRPAVVRRAPHWRRHVY